MTHEDYKALASELAYILALQNPPLAISFSKSAPAGIAVFREPMPAPTDD